MTAKKAPAKSGRQQIKKAPARPAPSKSAPSKSAASRKPAPKIRPFKPSAKPAAKSVITKPVIGTGKKFKPPVKQQPHTKVIKTMVKAKKATAKVPVKKAAVKKVAPKKPAKPAPKKAVKKAAPPKKGGAVSPKPPAVKKPAKKAVPTKPPAKLGGAVSPKPPARSANAPHLPNTSAKPKPPARSANAPHPKAPPPVVPAKPVATKKAVAPAKPAAPAKPYFKPDEIKGFKNALLALLRQLVSRVNQQLDDALPIVDKINIEEDGTEAFDRVVGLEQAGLDQAKINKIREALSAIENGTYGLCQECGCKIAIVRLKALPFAYTCVECQNKLDNPNGEKSRFVDLLD